MPVSKRCTMYFIFHIPNIVTTFWNKVWIENLISEKTQMPSFMDKEPWNELTDLFFDWYSQGTCVTNY